MASAAPNPAPFDTPSSPGFTKGLRNTPWNAAPDAANAAPTAAAASARGRRTCITSVADSFDTAPSNPGIQETSA